MSMNINGHHLEITPAIRAYVTEKLDRIKRHFDHVIDISVTLSVTKLVHQAEVTVHVRGKDFHAQAQASDMYAAIDALGDKLDRQLLKHKDRMTNHSAKPLKHQAEMVEPEGLN